MNDEKDVVQEEQQSTGLMAEEAQNIESEDNNAQEEGISHIQNEETGAEEELGEGEIYERPDWFPEKFWDEKDGPNIENMAKSINHLEKKLGETAPDQYDKDQVILTSGRLLFNAKSDHILLSAETSINLNTNDSVNIDAPTNFVVDTKKVLLGSKDATEPVILGNKFLKEFKQLCSDLAKLCEELPTTVIAPGMPNPGIGGTAAPVAAQAEKCIAMIEQFKSKVSITK